MDGVHQLRFHEETCIHADNKSELARDHGNKTDELCFDAAVEVAMSAIVGSAHVFPRPLPQLAFVAHQQFLHVQFQGLTQKY
ncbi:hypothetical protein J6590_103958 [Homalodisca vitripennis]|nr:hypothetical protein J6590_103958 [Homalodisca vitripennis]